MLTVRVDSPVSLQGADRADSAMCRGFILFQRFQTSPRARLWRKHEAGNTCSQSGRSRKTPPGHVAETSVARVGSRTGYSVRLISSLTRALAVMPLGSTAVETRRLDIHAAGSCRCSFESVLLGERPAAPAQHSSRTGLTRQPGGGLFVGSMGLCSQPHHAASVWPCQGRTALLERTREPFIREFVRGA